jgi:hypothetical protein
MFVTGSGLTSRFVSRQAPGLVYTSPFLFLNFGDIYTDLLKDGTIVRQIEPEGTRHNFR